MLVIEYFYFISYFLYLSNKQLFFYLCIKIKIIYNTYNASIFLSGGSEKMSEKNKKNFFPDYDFEFSTSSCFINTETTYSSPGASATIDYKLYSSKNKTHKYAYEDSYGLVLKDEGKSGLNVLAQFLRLRIDNAKDVESFFKDFGYLKELSESEFTRISVEELKIAQDRLKATIDIINNIEGERDYWKLFKSTANILLTSDNSEFIKSNPITDIVNNDNIVEEDWNSYFFKNTIVEINPTHKIKISQNEYISISAGEGLTNIKGSASHLFRQLFLAYLNQRNTRTEQEQKIIDFFFRFMYLHKVFRLEKANVVFYSNHNPDEKPFPEDMKTDLVSIAKIALGYEINANIQGIFPQYDYSKMSPTWKVPDLMSAMYFSVFYMRPGIQRFVKCKNPNCKGDGYFLKTASNERRQYCSDRCRNAFNQAMLRKNRKSEH